MVALVVTAIAVFGAVTLASTAVAQLNQARDRLIATRIADDLYERLSVGELPDGGHHGVQDGRSWRYSTEQAGTPDRPSTARRVDIVVDRRVEPDLVVEAYLRPVPVIQ